MSFNNASGSSFSGARNCTKCRRPCEGEAFVALKDGSIFHRFCFTCDICQNELPMKFALKNGKYYHTECYANAKAVAPKCLKCENPILSAEISVVIGNDMRFHSKCFACDTCQKPLSDRFYASGGKFYHEECVACSVCNAGLLGKNFSQLQDGGYICDNCLYNSMRSQGQLVHNNQADSYAPAPQMAQQGYFGAEGVAEEAWAAVGTDWNQQYHGQQSGGNYMYGNQQNGYGQPQPGGYNTQPRAGPPGGFMAQPGGYGGPGAQNGYYQPQQQQQQQQQYGGYQQTPQMGARPPVGVSGGFRR